MNRLLKVPLALGVIGSFVFCAQSISAFSHPPHPINLAQGSDQKALREFHGVKLGMKREAVKTAMGANPENSTDDSEDYKLTGDDTMTVRYENGEVKAIQLAFLDPKNAPAWKDVVGDAEVNELGNGAKTARQTIEKEKFWVSIYQNKEGTMVRITISRI
ncbi:MAG: hypothetical protein SF097_21145 [Acidobacteriota bacterium]|nr:hypothetical protein [Acidobacteriota bacterium]